MIDMCMRVTETHMTSNNAYVWSNVKFWACARPIFGSGVEIQRSFSFCFDVSIIGYCRELIQTLPIDPVAVEHVYTVFLNSESLSEKCVPFPVAILPARL